MVGIRDIAGVNCPMGCGQTLHLMQSGTILCLNQACTQPDAAQKILGDRETEHIAVFGVDSWTVVHPLRDRLGDLLFCPVHEAVGRLDGPPGGMTGRYRAKIDSAGVLELEMLDLPAPNGAG